MTTKNLLLGLGREIRERRRQHHLSQESLAFGAGLHRNVIGRLERGVLNPSVHTLFAIAVQLKVPLSELIAATERRTHQTLM